jgi:flagellar motor switch protein FliG
MANVAEAADTDGKGRSKTQARLELRQLTGAQKAAVVIMAIGETRAGKLLEKMDDEEIKEVSQAMATVGQVKADVVEELFRDFVAGFAGGGSLVGSFESTERLLAKIMGNDRVSDIMEDIRGPAGRTMWEKLANVNEQTLAQYLKNEYPQTIAVVMTKIKPDHAARVLGELPEELATEVVMRMLTAEPVRKEVLASLEQTLRTEFMANLARTSKRDSHEMIAEIFNNFDRSTEARFMSSLEERNKESAEKIKSLMFTFEDLSRLDPTGVQALLRAVDKTVLAVSLKGASESLRDLFLSNMSERAGKILREDMEAMGPVRLKDVEEGQGKMVAVAKELADKGEIVIAETGGDDELVY